MAGSGCRSHPPGRRGGPFCQAWSAGEFPQSSAPAVGRGRVLTSFLLGERRGGRLAAAAAVVASWSAEAAPCACRLRTCDVLQHAGRAPAALSGRAPVMCQVPNAAGAPASWLSMRPLRTSFRLK